MTALYGFESLKDLANQRVTEVGVGLVNTAIAQSVAEHNRQMGALMGLLAKQPAKFGQFVLKLRQEQSALKIIEEVYGWDEKKLTAEWHKYVLGQR